MRSLCQGGARSLALLSFCCLALAAAIALGGCGGGGDEESENSEATSAAHGTSAAPAQAEAQGDETREGSKGAGQPDHGASPNPPVAEERTPGSKAVAPGVPIAKGGDNSVQAFGLEGETEEASQALQALEEYLQARVAGDWAAACAAASEEFRSQLAMLIDRAKTKGEGAEKPEGCPETLELLYGKAPSQALREAAEVKQVLSFRVREDGYAYLIYEDGSGEARFIAMANEDGAWKVNTTEPTGFPETEGQGTAQ
jgi:hypothetical protein